jgi:hypothetical protein
MNDLQLALLAVAAALLAALFVWSKWQERRALRQFEQSLQSGVEDALLRPAVSVPAASSAAEAASNVPMPAPADFKRVLDAELNVVRREPTFADASTESARDEEIDEAPAPSSSTELDWIEDPMLDCVIELRCAHAVDGVTVFDAIAPLTQAQLPLPTHVVVWDARSQQWVKPDRFGFYTELLVAVQLAHRRARLGAVEVARFLAAVEQIAMRIDADFDAPDAAYIAQTALQLEQTSARFDVQVGLTLISASGPWDRARLVQAAAASGLSPAEATDADRWEARDESGRALYAVQPSSLLADCLSLELDVPLMPGAAHAETVPLRRMFDTAAQLATQLSARVVDDNGRDIDAASLAAVEAQLQALLGEMRAAGIEPGGARALRLYGPL